MTAMRAVIVTSLPSPNPATDKHGIYRRLALFVRGVSDVCEDVTIVHIAQRQFGSRDELNPSRDELSEYWGAPVATSSILADEAPRRLWQAAHAVFDIRYRGDYRPLLGVEQAQALQAILDERPDMIFAHRLPAMAALLRLSHRLAPIFFDLDDVEHRVRLRAARSASSLLQRWRRLVEVPALQRIERRAMRAAARTFVCSELDGDYLASRGYDAARTFVVANAVPLPERPAPLPRDKTILFLGNYGYPPNAEAAERLIASIWPQVRAKIGEARLIVAGAHPERIRFFNAPPPGVAFTGFVADLDALYARTRLVCCPIENGGGTRIKLIEAAGFGRPIVATRVAAEGLSLLPDRDILLRDADGDIAAACVDLLSDDEAAGALGRAARLAALSSYSFDRIRRQIADDFRNWLAQTPESASHAPVAGQALKPRIRIGSRAATFNASRE